MPTAFQREALRAEAAYTARIGALAVAVRTKYVVPFCDRHGCVFKAGMGGWQFQWPDGRRATDGDGSAFRLPSRLASALKIKVFYGANSLGTIIEDYAPASLARDAG